MVVQQNTGINHSRSMARDFHEHEWPLFLIQLIVSSSVGQTMSKYHEAEQEVFDRNTDMRGATSSLLQCNII